MPIYKYKALNRSGVSVDGEIEAASEQDVFSQLKARKLDVFDVSKRPPQIELFKRRRKISTKEMARYIRQLATLLKAGVTLMDALASLARANAHPGLSQASQNIIRDLRAGESLSKAMGEHLPQLPRYVPRLAELGEATGQSASALSDAADRMEFEEEMRSQVRTALSYPVFLSVVGGLIVVLLFLFVVPRFDELIGENRDNLPAISSAVLGFGRLFKEQFILVSAAFLGLVFAGVLVAHNRRLTGLIRSRLERLPVIGPVLVQSDLGGWARTVGIALSNGAPLLDALILGEYGVRSARLRTALMAARAEIRTGRNIDEALNETIPDFDPLTIDLIRTGRASGGLADMFLFVGESQERETQELSKRLSSLAEPIAILLISMIVGTIVISIVLAMTSLYDFSI